MRKTKRKGKQPAGKVKIRKPGGRPRRRVPVRPGPTQCAFATPEVLPQGDGSVLVKPGKPVSKLTVAQAAELAHCSVWGIYRLHDAGLIQGERPLPRRTLIYADSLLAHLASTRDLEYWEKPTNRRRYVRATELPRQT